MRSLSQLLGRAARRAVRDRRLAVYLWLLQLTAALPFAWVVGDALHEDIGARASHTALDGGFAMEWWSEWSQEAPGVAASFEPGRVLGAAPYLRNLEGAWLGSLFDQPAWLLAAASLFGLAWLLLLGGVLGQLAEEGGRPALHRVLADGAALWSRMTALALVTAPLWVAPFALARFAFRRLESSTQDVTSETSILFVYLATAALLAAALAAVRTLADLARAAVVHQGCGVLRALALAARVLFRRPMTCLLATRLPGALGLLVIPLLAVLTPASTRSGWLPIVWTLLVVQSALLARLWLRVVGLAAALEIWSAETADR